MSDEIRSPHGRSYLFTSESVTEGHPDKIADQISDAVLDAILDKEAKLEAQGYVDTDGVPARLDAVRCACETMLTTGMVVISGEIRTQAYVDVQRIARDVICRIGYDRAKYGFDGTTCGVINMIHGQSPDIAQGVDESFAVQAGESSDPLDQVGAGDRRDADAHAHAALPGEPARRAPRRGAPQRYCALPAAGRQDSGERPL